MASSFGQILKITIFGESHAKGIGMTIDGLPAGLAIDNDEIKKAMQKRHGNSEISTERHENDEVEFVCGVFNNVTTGSPLTFIIYNTDVHSSSYKEGDVRPSHADLTNYIKYNGYNDYRGGGFSSGRITASFIVLGCICNQLLKKHNITICSRIYSIHGVFDDEINEKDVKNYLNLLDDDFPVISEKQKAAMINEIKNAKKANDSVGGVIESFIIGAPIGLGEPYFNSMESAISQLFFSIGGIKGIEFGDGFGLSNKFGSEVKDEIRLNNNNIEYLSNHNGGLNGGISNGDIIHLKTAIKPTSSFKQQFSTINIKDQENKTLLLDGRYDSCFVQRVLPVLNALLAYVVVDMLMAKESKNI